MEDRSQTTGQKTFHVEPRLDVLLDVQLADLQRLASLGVLAGAVLHEINNALTPALSYSQLALANPSDHQLAAKALERAVAGIRHATRIAESTLGLVMVSENTGGNTRIGVPLPTVVDAARSSVLMQIEKLGLSLYIQCTAGLTVAMNPLELQQVLVNLLSNSIRSTGPGGSIHLNCSTWNTGTGRGVEIEMIDSGSGVDNAVRERLFQPLASGAHGGHGFGLMVSRRMVEAAGGQLEFDGDYSPGARFVIRIPP